MHGRNPYCNVACINDGVSRVGCSPKRVVDLVTRPNGEQDEESCLAYSQTQIQNLLEGENVLIRQ